MLETRDTAAAPGDGSARGAVVSTALQPATPATYFLATNQKHSCVDDVLSQMAFAWQFDNCFSSPVLAARKILRPSSMPSCTCSPVRRPAKSSSGTIAPTLEGLPRLSACAPKSLPPALVSGSSPGHDNGAFLPGPLQPEREITRRATGRAEWLCASSGPWLHGPRLRARSICQAAAQGPQVEACISVWTRTGQIRHGTVP